MSETPKKITAMFAFISTDENGDDSVPAFIMPNGMWMPLTGADLERVQSLQSIAQELANASGRGMRIVVFSEMTLIGTIEPAGRT